MILDIYKDSLEYALQDGESILKLGVIGILSFLIIPLFMVLGYGYRVIQVSINGMINGDDKLPDFSDLIGMFVDGLKVFLVKFVYLLIPIVIFMLFAVGSVGLTNINDFAGNTTMMIGLVVSIVLAIFFYLLSLVSIAYMAENNGSIKAAFDFKGIYNVICSIGWLRFIGFYIGLLIIEIVIFTIFLIVIGIIAGIVSAFGLVGGLASGAVAGGAAIIMAVLSTIIFSFLIEPYITILENRAVGLIYNIRE